MKETDGTEKKVATSYFSKDRVMCPVCKQDFAKEVMLSGQGRMIAGELTDELHRQFEPSKKYGLIYPLIYDVGACPNCYAALFWNDFKDLKKADAQDKILTSAESRVEGVSAVFPHFDLKRPRTLFDGCAMYYLALFTYDKVGAELFPTVKRAIITLRLAWLCKDLNAACPGRNYDYMAQVFYRKAAFFYQQSLVVELDRTEHSSSVSNSGPDMDKNYGWDGVVYLNGLLEYKYGQKEDMQLRLKKLSEAKTAIARLFGLGKSSKAKPGPLLEKSRELYNLLSAELKEEGI